MLDLFLKDKEDMLGVLENRPGSLFVIRSKMRAKECLVMLVTKRDRWESTSQRASNV
jgi:hypothetical protein